MWTIGRLRNCLDAHLGQIVCDKDWVVDWCIVLVEMPRTRFEIRIGQSSHKMYSNNILNVQESTTILNAHPKKCLETYRMHLVSIYLSTCVYECVYIYIYIYRQLYIYIYRERERKERTKSVLKIYLSIYLSIYMRVCVCVCVCSWPAVIHLSMSD